MFVGYGTLSTSACFGSFWWLFPLWNGVSLNVFPLPRLRFQVIGRRASASCSVVWAWPSWFLGEWDVLICFSFFLPAHFFFFFFSLHADTVELWNVLLVYLLHVKFTLWQKETKNMTPWYLPSVVLQLLLACPPFRSPPHNFCQSLTMLEESTNKIQVVF